MAGEGQGGADDHDRERLLSALKIPFLSVEIGWKCGGVKYRTVIIVTRLVVKHMFG